jgi:hypothetical protein
LINPLPQQKTKQRGDRGKFLHTILRTQKLQNFRLTITHCGPEMNKIQAVSVKNGDAKEKIRDEHVRKMTTGEMEMRIVKARRQPSEHRSIVMIAVIAFFRSVFETFPFIPAFSLYIVLACHFVLE